jgi:hypothetical protein
MFCKCTKLIIRTEGNRLFTACLDCGKESVGIETGPRVQQKIDETEQAVEEATEIVDRVISEHERPKALGAHA